MIAVPRWLLLVLGALFSAYHVILGIYTLDVPRSPWPTVVALVLYSIATVASLWPVRRVRMPDWLAAFDLAVSIVLPLLVTSTSRSQRGTAITAHRLPRWRPAT